MTDPQVYGATWYAATMVPAPERDRLTFDLDVDVCVVGGGLAGLTTAREVARRGWSVAVLEAQRIAWNASGRNDGFVLPGFADDIEEIVARVGLDHAKQLWSLSAAGADYVRLHISEAELPGVAPVPGWLSVSQTDRANALRRRCEFLREELAVPVEVWPTERVRAVLKSHAYFQALYFPRAFHIHPLNYALGLARVAEQHGVRIFEHTPALAIDPTGVRKRITTPLARVRASHIVLAGNTHLGALMPRLAQTLLPLTTYVATTGPLLGDLAEAVTTSAAVSDGRGADSHYRIVGGDRLMWTGRLTSWSADPRRYVKSLRGDIARIYPQLGQVPIEYIWSGELGRAVHRMPQIGELAKGLWVASAFSGHGLNTTAMAGCLLARAITEGDDTMRLFAPYELVWAGGTLGRTAAQVVYWGTRMRDRALGALSRHGERVRLRAAPARRRAQGVAAESATAAPGKSRAKAEPQALAPHRFEAAVEDLAGADPAGREMPASRARRRAQGQRAPKAQAAEAGPQDSSGDDSQAGEAAPSTVRRPSSVV